MVTVHRSVYGGKPQGTCGKIRCFKGQLCYTKALQQFRQRCKVYVIGGKIITAMLRISDKDFRSNFCLGGRAEVYNLSDEEREKVGKL